MLLPLPLLALLLAILLSLVLVILILLINFRYLHMAMAAPSHDASAEASAAARHRAQKILDDATTRAQGIIEKAENSAHQLLADTEFFGKKSQEHLEKQLKLVSEEQLTEYKKFSEHLRQELSAAFAQYQETLSQDASQSLHDFQEKTTAAQAELVKSLQSQHQEQLAKMKDDAVDYRAQVWENINETLPTLIQAICASVVKKSLSPKEHQDLVIAALDEAKKRHVI